MRALGLDSRQPPPAAESPLVATVTPDPARLAGALRFRTISLNDTVAPDSAAMLGLHRYLAATFPRVHAALAPEVVAGYSLLYTWRGSDSTMPPMVLASHLDVVPVEAGTENRWTRPPFAGDTAGGFLWGRGTLDDKLGVVGILEAAEHLLANGFVPRRTTIFAFGHDEELGGYRGAAALAATLRQRYSKVAALVDEGSLIADTGLVPGMRRPVALIGIAEKSSANVELVAEAAGGHSSMPPRHSAVGTLSEAIIRLEREQMPAHFGGVSERMFDYLAPEMSFGQRAIFANLWLFRPLVRRIFEARAGTNAMVRTTTAATMVSGSPKENVLPIRARAVVNFRVLPGDSTADVLAHVRRVVADTSIRVRLLGAPSEPSPVTDPTGPGFALVAGAARRAFPDAVVAPYLMVGGTDTRHYESLTRDIVRFLPVVANDSDVTRLHGTDERVSVAGYASAVRFYAQLIVGAASR